MTVGEGSSPRQRGSQFQSDSDSEKYVHSSGAVLTLLAWTPERQSAISAARIIGSGARAFGAEVVKFTIRAAYLTVESLCRLPDPVILTELIAVVAQS